MRPPSHVVGTAESAAHAWLVAPVHLAFRSGKAVVDLAVAERRVRLGAAFYDAVPCWRAWLVFSVPTALPSRVMEPAESAGNGLAEAIIYQASSGNVGRAGIGSPAHPHPHVVLDAETFADLAIFSAPFNAALALGYHRTTPLLVLVGSRPGVLAHRRAFSCPVYEARVLLSLASRASSHSSISVRKNLKNPPAFVGRGALPRIRESCSMLTPNHFAIWPAVM